MIKNLLRKNVEQYPKLAQFYRHCREFLNRDKPSLKTPWEFTIAGHELMASGKYELDETNLIRKLLKESDIFINIGANVGYYCCHALSMGKQVVAIEPIASNFYYLLRNIDENGWAKQAELYPVAVGSHIDILDIWGGGTGASLVKGWAGTSEIYVSRVPVLTLDRILQDSLDNKRALILVDVEGAEYSVMLGALKTLNHNPRPNWIIEIGTTQHYPTNIYINPNFVSTFEIFFNSGYKAYTADKNQIPITLDEIRYISERKKTLNNYNFIFKHEN
jgi:FkbM family methyltransferase